MNRHLFITLIVFVGVMVMFFFYKIWEGDVPKKITIHSNNAHITYLPETKNTEKTIDTKTSLNKIATHKKSTFISVKKERVSEDIPYDNPVSMEAHTQDVYTTLLPDNYDKSIEKADASFNVLDRHVNKISQRLDEHMKIAAMRKSVREKELLPIEDTYEMVLPTIQE